MLPRLMQSGRASAYDLRLYEIFRKYVEHEDDLINNRVGWFIQLHSFLIASYGIIVASLIGTFFPQGKPSVPPLLTQGVACLFLVAVQIVGIASSRSAGQSIAAATIAIAKLRKTWDDHCVKNPHTVDLPRLTGGGEEASVKTGLRLPSRLPRTIELLWIFSTIVPLVFFIASSWASYLSWPL